VDEIPILGRDDDRHMFQHFLAQYDAPAYVRRARQVQDAFDELLARCRRQREEWLAMVCTRLATLYALAGEWDRLRPLLAEDTLRELRELHAELASEVRVPTERTSSVRALRRAVTELKESAERFNRRWRDYLSKVDLSPVNQLRIGYNRYYLLEKECAVRSPRLARQGFRRLAPLTREELTALLPPVPVPALKH
jgi:hypothetical protein